MRFKDKLYEAKYHLKRIKEESITILDDVKARHRFRFEIGSFFSAARSVTWVIKKDLSDKADFKEWYTKEVESKLTQFKKTVNLRNILEKEGNRFPLFVML